MRRLAVLATVLLLPSVALAGDHAGALKLSGNTSFAFSRTTTSADGNPEELESRRTDVQLEGYYLLTGGLGVGAWLDYAREKTTYLGASAEARGRLVGPAVLVELPIGPQAAFFADAAWLFSKSTEEDEFGDLEVSGSGFGGRLGFAYFPAHAVSLDVGLRVARLTQDFDGTDVTATSVGFGVGISVYLGGAATDPTPIGRAGGATSVW